MSDAWYLDADDYFVTAANASEHPLRQGDLITVAPVDGEDWTAAQIVHPTCELEKSTVKEIQVVRVRPLTDAPDDFFRSLLVAGFREIDGGRRVALAHTFFLPPFPDSNGPCFVNFREIQLLPRDQVVVDRRLAAITHDCRVSFIRRWLYFRFRLAFSFEQVRSWEAVRISGDANFQGPRPEWAT